MMKKIILHVGQYKTGTSSIQSMLWHNREALSQQGVLYPEAFIRDAAHFQITDRLRLTYRKLTKSVDLSPLRDEIERSDAHTVVISCEPLSGATVRRFAPDMMSYMWSTLAELLEGFEVRVLYYARRQDESIDSRIIQEIKGQARRSSTDYRPFLYEKSSLNFPYFTGQLEEVFGKGNVDIRPYDRKYLKNADVRVDFLDYLGVDVSCLSIPHGEDNVSPSARLVAFYRVINSLGLSDEDYARVIAGQWREMGAMDEAKAVVLGAEEREAIMAYFKGSNERFVESMQENGDGAGFGEVLFGEVKPVRSNVYIDGVEVLEVLRSRGFGVVRVA